MTAIDETDSNPAIVTIPEPDSVLPLGTTEVTATGTDAAGNAATCSFQVTVQDTTPPTVVCPHDVAGSTTDPSGTTVQFVVAGASDAVTSQPTTVAAPASGECVPGGQYARRGDCHGRRGQRRAV